ncbi:MAG: hypothetical protein EZS28_020800 [Streblomastix strix]|uniref:Uncharacterized protein n=1 Tax=Streblomastix strix TaxID=222440 RepID=A0A5J4VM32_9EUKA|nr:MAG: hypothetical protein EZS28_020800 [Streblomastix strix]
MKPPLSNTITSIQVDSNTGLIYANNMNRAPSSPPQKSHGLSNSQLIQEQKEKKQEETVKLLKNIQDMAIAEQNANTDYENLHNQFLQRWFLTKKSGESEQQGAFVPLSPILPHDYPFSSIRQVHTSVDPERSVVSQSFATLASQQTSALPIAIDRKKYIEQQINHKQSSEQLSPIVQSQSTDSLTKIDYDQTGSNRIGNSPTLNTSNMRAQKRQSQHPPSPFNPIKPWLYKRPFIPQIVGGSHINEGLNSNSTKIQSFTNQDKITPIVYKYHRYYAAMRPASQLPNPFNLIRQKRAFASASANAGTLAYIHQSDDMEFEFDEREYFEGSDVEVEETGFGQTLPQQQIDDNQNDMNGENQTTKQQQIVNKNNSNQQSPKQTNLQQTSPIKRRHKTVVEQLLDQEKEQKRMKLRSEYMTKLMKKQRKGIKVLPTFSAPTAQTAAKKINELKQGNNNIHQYDNDDSDSDSYDELYQDFEDELDNDYYAVPSESINNFKYRQQMGEQQRKKRQQMEIEMEQTLKKKQKEAELLRKSKQKKKAPIISGQESQSKEQQIETDNINKDNIIQFKQQKFEQKLERARQRKKEKIEQNKLEKEHQKKQDEEQIAEQQDKEKDNDIIDKQDSNQNELDSMTFLSEDSSDNEQEQEFIHSFSESNMRKVLFGEDFNPSTNVQIQGQKLNVINATEAMIKEQQNQQLEKERKEKKMKDREQKYYTIIKKTQPNKKNISKQELIQNNIILDKNEEEDQSDEESDNQIQNINQTLKTKQKNESEIVRMMRMQKNADADDYSKSTKGNKEIIEKEKKIKDSNVLGNAEFCWKVNDSLNPVKEQGLQLGLQTKNVLNLSKFTGKLKIKKDVSFKNKQFSPLETKKAEFNYQSPNTNLNDEKISIHVKDPKKEKTMEIQPPIYERKKSFDNLINIPKSPTYVSVSAISSPRYMDDQKQFEQEIVQLGLKKPKQQSAREPQLHREENHNKMNHNLLI